MIRSLPKNPFRVGAGQAVFREMSAALRGNLAANRRVQDDLPVARPIRHSQSANDKRVRVSDFSNGERSLVQ
jgi:hypothetical protein